MKHPDLEKKPMITRMSILAIAAAAGLGASVLMPTDAAARGFGGGGGGGGFGHGGGMSHGGGFARGPALRSMGHVPTMTRTAHLPIKSGLHKISKLPIKPGPTKFAKFSKPGPHKHWCHHHHCNPWFVDWHTPHYVVDVVEPATAVIEKTALVESVAAPVVAPVQRGDTCTCLTKQYLPDGSVLFSDVCTKEEAMATPEELKAQAQGATPRVTR
jgi:hypothetical protein